MDFAFTKLVVSKYYTELHREAQSYTEAVGFKEETDHRFTVSLFPFFNFGVQFSPSPHLPISLVFSYFTIELFKISTAIGPSLKRRSRILKLGAKPNFS